ncbi:MAG: phenylalanine--tRNA ligase subunit beta [Methanobacteriaceae archaeon]|nr:phenylalanine--tRNA ligase subunit beta [Methanobacteriaceae archaeon]
MPVINFTYQNLNELLGTSIDKGELIDLLPMIGSDIEDYDDENLKVEFFPNRPDHYSVEGIARTLKGFLQIEMGIPHYDLTPSGTSITVDPGLANIRPYTSCALVEGINLDDDKLVQIMEFQEDLHWVLGRDRKKVAIGIHNLDVLTPPFYYKAADPLTTSFVALDTDEEMNLQEILENHKKGRAYAHIIDKFDKYPLLIDSEDNVLSMPPIINGELTKLTADTKNVFVDVTGTDKKAVDHTLNIITTSFAESGAKIKTMDVIYPYETRTLPDLTPKKKVLRVENAQRMIGIDSSRDEIIGMLRRVRLDAEALNEDEIEVSIPPYRIDVLHEVDIIENVAIGYDFRKIRARLPDVATVASEDPHKAFENRVREIMIGYGFYEVMSLMLTSEEQHYQKMNLPEDQRVVVAQPISQDRTMIRKSLLNGLMEFLEDNTHEELPQKIFEVGEVVYLDESAETRTRGVSKLAALVTHSTANFTEIKSLTASLISNLGLQMTVKPLDHPSFIKGRCAEVVTKGDEVKGFFGEVSPLVISNFNLEYPVVGFELEFNN